jgi:hypothetical protein
VPIPISSNTVTAAVDGTATFNFTPGPLLGQVYQGTVSCPNAPGSAQFTPIISNQPSSGWIGVNTGGPYSIQSSDTMTVTATGLQPGITYTCRFIGQVISTADYAYQPEASTAIVQPPNALLLGLDHIAFGGGPDVFTISLDTTWRAIWVIAKGVSGPAPVGAATLTGTQSGLNYVPFLPPYFNNGTLYRFPLLAGVDSTARLTFTNTVAVQMNAWYGADLADVDAVIYNTSGVSPGMYYASLTGTGETTNPGDLTQNGNLTVNNALITTANVATATANAYTVPINFHVTEVANNSAGAMTLTMALTGTDPVAPVRSQPMIVRIYDFSGASQTLSWVNTENSKNVSVPTTTAGSTTIPLNVGFLYNAKTSLWTCVAVA